MALKDICIRALDTLYREPKLHACQYKIGNRVKGDCKERNIFMVDGRIPHGGMFDRLKGAISVYAISRALGVDFKIYWTYPFDLKRYLMPVKRSNSHCLDKSSGLSDGYLCNWTLHNEEEINYSLFTSRNIIAYGEYNTPSRLWKKRKKETHFYYGYNSLDKINKHFDSQFEWGALYRELFQPTPYLQQYLDRYNREIGEDYIVFHTRFLNLLGDKNEIESLNPELPTNEKKESLMKSAVECIGKIGTKYIAATQHSCKIMLSSDSMKFIEYAKSYLPNLYIVPGYVKHIDTARDTDDTENIKLFTDYYLIAGAEKVYSLWHEGMWKSAFPEYAAKIGNVPFERITF